MLKTHLHATEIIGLQYPPKDCLVVVEILIDIIIIGSLHTEGIHIQQCDVLSMDKLSWQMYKRVHIEVVREHVTEALDVVMAVGDDGFIECVVTYGITATTDIRLINLWYDENKNDN